MMNPPSHVARACKLLVIAGAFGAAFACRAADERESPPIRQVQEIPLPGVQGRLDHFTLDLKRKRVIFSGLGNNSVQVVDAFAGKMIQNIPGLSQPQGTFYLQEGDKLYVANAADGHVNIYNGTKFNLLKRLEIGEDPDNLRYDPATKLLYVGYGDGAITAIDTKTDTHVKKIDFKVTGHPEGFQMETKGPRIFVNIADSKNIAVIDRNTGATTYWALPAGHLANFPMVLDEENRRVIIGTRRPSRMTVYDMDSGKVVASLPSTGDMDDIFYDALRKRIYVSGGEGFISVFQQKDANTYEPMGKFATSVGTRTGAWYVKRDRLYLAAPPANGLGARILVFEPQD